MSLSGSTTARTGMVTFSGITLFPLMRCPAHEPIVAIKIHYIGEERGRHRIFIESPALDQKMGAQSCGVVPA
jgi:hypothetical protein